MLAGVIFLVFLTIFISGEPSLLIYKIVDGTHYPITGIVRVTKGHNLTLNCRDVTSSENDVSWSKKSEIHENVIPVEDSSTISFTPATIKDDGIYICTSIKSNLSRPIAIVVYGNDLRNNRRLKRTQYGFPDFAQTYKSGIEYPTVPDPVGDFFKNNKKQVKPTSYPTWLERNKDMISHLGVDESENWLSNVRPGSNWYTSNLASGNLPSNTIFDDLYKKSIEKVVETQDSSIGNNQYTVLYCMVIFGGLLLFGGIMCMCVRNNPNVRSHLDRTTSISPACSHAMCVRHRDTNPLAGCILSTLNATNRIPTPMVHTNDDGDITVLTFPNEHIDSIDFDDVPDTPPSYSNTIDDIKTDLPPSYDEVLQNMLPPSYSTYQSTSTAIDASASQSNMPLVNDA